MVKKGGYHNQSSYSSYSQSNWQQPVKQTVRSAELSYTVPQKKTTYPELNKGDMVMHSAFGKGLVLSVMKLGNDALLEVAFDKVGTKKLMAGTASAHMKKL
jgi:hypothetical protein